MSNYRFEFSAVGMGQWFKRYFDTVAARPFGEFPNTSRGETIVLIADFASSARSPYFDTYSFLIFDLDKNHSWGAAQKHFRSSAFPYGRRMAFKSLNDSRRRAAMRDFLKMSDLISGQLVTFAIARDVGTLFESVSNLQAREALSNWKPHVRERLMRIIHMSVFLLSGFSTANQNLLWLVDQDEIVANRRQLTEATKIFARIWSHVATHSLAHIRCGTTASDNGTLEIEDLASIPDLAAGAVAECVAAQHREGRVPGEKLLLPFPTSVSYKTKALLAWHGFDEAPLRKKTILVTKAYSERLITKELTWHAIPQVAI